jgi:hypothetical protein
MKPPGPVVIVLALLCNTLQAFSGESKRPAVYVWDFTAESQENPTVLRALTSDFETALIQCGRYTVLERRDINKLLTQVTNERKVTHLGQIPEADQGVLKLHRADMVVLGEVLVDTNSAQCEVTVTFEDFAGQKRAKRRTLFDRDLLTNALSRTSQMSRLVDEASTALAKPPSMKPSAAPGDNSSTINNSGTFLNGQLSNSGTIISGNSNSLVINIWHDSFKSGFDGAGNFRFPPDSTQRMKELENLAQTEDFKLAIKPFAAYGTFQPGPGGTLQRDDHITPRPISYNKLYHNGALADSTRGGDILVRLAVNHADTMRPRWPREWASKWHDESDAIRIVTNAQRWVRDYHEEMVALGILSE